jgi:hypothetical protein
MADLNSWSSERRASQPQGEAIPREVATEMATEAESNKLVLAIIGCNLISAIVLAALLLIGSPSRASEARYVEGAGSQQNAQAVRAEGVSTDKLVRGSVRAAGVAVTHAMLEPVGPLRLVVRHAGVRE